MRRYLPDLLHGFGVTVALAALAIVIGLSVGFGLAVVRTFQVRPVNWVLVLLVRLVSCFGRVRQRATCPACGGRIGRQPSVTGRDGRRMHRGCADGADPQAG